MTPRDDWRERAIATVTRRLRGACRSKGQPFASENAVRALAESIVDSLRLTAASEGSAVNDPALPVRAERLMNTYARALRRYLAAEKALAASPEPVPTELVYEHAESAEHFQTLRGVLGASIKRTLAFTETEDCDV